MALSKHKYLSDTDYNFLIAHLTRFRGKAIRDILLLEILLYTGCRASEALLIRSSDINHQDCSLFLHGLKGSNDREIPLSRELYLRLVSYASGKDRLFPITYKRLFQIWDHYRPFPRKLHSLRHTFALRVYKKTLDIRLVQSVLGHKDLKTTLIYQDYCYSIDEKRSIL